MWSHILSLLFPCISTFSCHCWCCGSTYCCFPRRTERLSGTFFWRVWWRSSVLPTRLFNSLVGRQVLSWRALPDPIIIFSWKKNIYLIAESYLYIIWFITRLDHMNVFFPEHLEDLYSITTARCLCVCFSDQKEQYSGSST